MPARVETRGRARALQALYAWDVRGGEDLVRIAATLWDDMQVPAAEREFADRLIRRVAEGRVQLDADLADVTTHWRIERLGAIERCVLRLGVAEFAQGGNQAQEFGAGAALGNDDGGVPRRDDAEVAVRRLDRM